MPKSVKISILALSVAFVLAMFLGVNMRGVRAAADPQGTDGAYRQMAVYQEVLQHIQNDYVVDPNMQAVTGGALRGLLESLDADSSYLSPADYKAYKADKGGKGQTGIHVSKRFGYATVVSVIPGSPADKAGLVDGDIIEAIGNQDTRDLSLATIKMLLAGAPGSEVQVAVIRPRKPEPDKLTLNRVVLSEPSVNETVFENATILDLRPGAIDREHVNAIESKLKAMGKSGNKKVLLDLRDVSTGDMAEGVRLANFFLKSGTIATLQGQTVPTQTFSAEAGKAIEPNAPLVVLVNHGTAGAAELVAGALADNKRADLVGEKTFGEGSQQKTFEMADGAALILSVAKYATPSGKKFQDEGITPGTLVATAAELASDDDADSAAATSNVAGAASATTKATPTKRPAPQSDDQLNKALEMLKAKAA